jgi:hypothetical protein
VLGHHNSATKTTTLTDKKGTPLSLVGKTSKPPLKVNSSTLVKHLNAAKVGGFTATQLRGLGSAATIGNRPDQVFAGTGTGVEIPMLGGTMENPIFHTVAVVRTARLAAGSYLVTANAYGVNVACWIETTAALTKPENLFPLGVFSGNPEAGSATRGIVLSKPAIVSEYCYGTSLTDPGLVATAGITAVRVGSMLPGTHATATSVGGIRKAVTGR